MADQTTGLFCKLAAEEAVSTLPGTFTWKGFSTPPPSLARRQGTKVLR
eukprot:CAMPEP_0167820022 /NCGR_PEP_ID=MMETSP0112_2-20121227/5814_1 /TAXON_ID=91324 /ORGANISM="Lotharella globosa, Strain CCCM811" /LENGTH=47 /DNA_ID= /DNA_START= /DNA_END= /DNA_ORIENTATION=